MNCRWKWFCVLMFLSLFLSCAGNPPVSADSSQAVLGIDRLDAVGLKKYTVSMMNPYVVRSSLFFKPKTVFYVFEVRLLPAQDADIKIVSAALLDADGASIGKLLTIDQLRRYWKDYDLSEEDASTLQSVIERTYLGKTNFKYSSKRGKSYVLLFEGDLPARELCIAKFVFEVNGHELLIDAR